MFDVTFERENLTFENREYDFTKVPLKFAIRREFRSNSLSLTLRNMYPQKDILVARDVVLSEDIILRGNVELLDANPSQQQLRFVYDFKRPFYGKFNTLRFEANLYQDVPVQRFISLDSFRTPLYNQ